MDATRLAIGTAQFGLNYGISNHSGQVQPEEIQQILYQAQQTKVTTLDTAIAYGESEQALGTNDLQAFNVITKLPSVPSSCINIETWVNEQITNSLVRLNISQLDAVLLHRPEQLLQERGEKLYQALLQLKEAKKCRRIGISVYSPEELAPIYNKFKLDLVQLPMNVFDQRALHSSWLERLHQENIAVHVRSLFLQGLLLMPSHNRPAVFNEWQPQWHSWLNEQSISPLEGCLRPFLAIPEIEKLVIGIDCLAQLNEIIQVLSQPALPMPTQLSCSDTRLLNPSLWSK